MKFKILILLHVSCIQITYAEHLARVRKEKRLLDPFIVNPFIVNPFITFVRVWKLGQPNKWYGTRMRSVRKVIYIYSLRLWIIHRFIIIFHTVLVAYCNISWPVALSRSIVQAYLPNTFMARTVANEVQCPNSNNTFRVLYHIAKIITKICLWLLNQIQGIAISF